MTSEADPGLTRGTSAFTLGVRSEPPVPAYAQNIHSGEYPEYGGGGEALVLADVDGDGDAVLRLAALASAADLAGIVAPNGDPRSTTPR